MPDNNNLTINDFEEVDSETMAYYGKKFNYFVDMSSQTPKTYTLDIRNEENFELIKTSNFEKFDDLIVMVREFEELPDPTITVSDMKEYGYTWEGMLPLNADAAINMYKDNEIFLLYSDDTEGAAKDLEDIKRHAENGGIFGIEKDDWSITKQTEIEDEQIKEKVSPEPPEPVQKPTEQPEHITYGILKDPEAPGLMEDSYIVVEHTKTSGEHKAYDPLTHVVYKGSQKDCTDIKEKLTNKEITTDAAKELMSTAAKESVDEKVINEFETFEKTHKEKIKAAQAEHVTIVINAFAGPGAGKTVACMDICAELKKAGYNAEYVQEYAKELVYEGDMEKLNGSIKSQWEIFKEQVSRVDRLIGKTDFIVTDSPALLSPIYLADNTSRESYLFEKLAAKTHEHYNNFSFFLKRDESSFQEEGRIHNFAESKEKDKEIKDCLKRNNIFCCTYSRENVNRISENAALTYKRIKENPPRQKKEQQIKKKITI